MPYALVHCAFLPPLRVTPSPSEHPRARPSASHHCKPVRDAPAHRGPSPPNSTEIQRPSQPLSLGDTSQQGPPVARPQHLEGSGETEHWFLSPVSPSQERGVGSPTFTKGLIAMTPVGVGWSGEDVESPQKKEAILAAGDPVLWAPQPTPSPGWTQGCLLLAGRGPWLLSRAQLSLSRAQS